LVVAAIAHLGVNPPEPGGKSLQDFCWRGGAGLVKAEVQSATGMVADEFIGLRVVQRSL